MTRENLIRLKCILSTGALTALMVGTSLYNTGKKEDKMINAYIYELDNKDNKVSENKITAEIEDINNQHIMDEYIGENVKIVDVNEEYIIEKLETNGITSTSYVYYKTDEGYSNPILINTTEKEYYKIFNIVNSTIGRNNNVKKLTK